MARIPGINASFDSVNSATINRWMKSNYTYTAAARKPLMYMLLKMEKVTKGHGYGYFYPVRIPVATGPKLTPVADGYLSLPTSTPMGGYSGFNYVPAMFNYKFGIEIYDEAAQGSETEKINYKERDLKQAVQQIYAGYQSQLWAAEGNAGSNGTSRSSLCSWRVLLNGGGSSSSAGGIEDAKPQQKVAAVGTTPLTNLAGVERNGPGGWYEVPNMYTTAESFSIATLGRMHIATTHDNQAANYCMVPEKVYNFIDQDAYGKQRGSFGDSELAKLGYQALRWKNMEIVIDDGVPSIDKGSTYNEIYMVNLDFVEWRYSNSFIPNFKEIPNVGQNALQEYQTWMIGQLCMADTGRDHATHRAITGVGL